MGTVVCILSTLFLLPRIDTSVDRTGILQWQIVVVYLNFPRNVHSRPQLGAQDQFLNCWVRHLLQLWTSRVEFDGFLIVSFELHLGGGVSLWDVKAEHWVSLSHRGSLQRVAPKIRNAKRFCSWRDLTPDPHQGLSGNYRSFDSVRRSVLRVLSLSSLSLVEKLFWRTDYISRNQFLLLVNFWSLRRNKVELGFIKEIVFINSSDQKLLKDLQLLVPKFVLLQNLFSTEGGSKGRPCSGLDVIQVYFWNDVVAGVHFFFGVARE